MVYLFIIFLSSLAGLVQGVTGFGAGLVLMSVLPYFFGIVKGAAVSNFICLFMTGFMVKKYFKDIDWSKIYLAICLFVGGSLGAIYFVDKVNHNLLQLFFDYF